MKKEWDKVQEEEMEDLDDKVNNDEEKVINNDNNRPMLSSGGREGYREKTRFIYPEREGRITKRRRQGSTSTMLLKDRETLYESNNCSEFLKIHNITFLCYHFRPFISLS